MAAIGSTRGGKRPRGGGTSPDAPLLPPHAAAAAATVGTPLPPPVVPTTTSAQLVAVSRTSASSGRVTRSIAMQAGAGAAGGSSGAAAAANEGASRSSGGGAASAAVPVAAGGGTGRHRRGSAAAGGSAGADTCAPTAHADAEAAAAAARVAREYVAGYDDDAAVGFRTGAFGVEGWARRDIGAGETLGELPYDHIMTEAYAAATPVGAAALAALAAAAPPILTPGRLALYCVMVVERFSDAPPPPARFASYLRALPAAYDDPLWWDDAAAAYLRGTDVAAAVADRRAWLERALAALTAASAAAAANHPGWAPLSGLLRWETLRWAHSTHASRAFPASLGAPPGAAVDDAAVGCLLPGLDLLNHQYRTRITWERRPSGVAFVTADGCAAGRQVFNNYGAKSNDEFLVGYGFVLRDNLHDAAAVRVGVGGPAGTRFAAARDALGLPALVSWSWAAAGGVTVPDELLATMRLATWLQWHGRAGTADVDALRAIVAAPLAPPAAERFVALQLASLLAGRVTALGATPLPTTAPVHPHIAMACAYRRGQARLLAAMFAAALRPLTVPELVAVRDASAPPVFTCSPLPPPRWLGCGAYRVATPLPAGATVASWDGADPLLCRATGHDAAHLWPAVDTATREDDDDSDAPPRMRAAFALAAWIMGEAEVGLSPSARAAVRWAEEAFGDAAVSAFVDSQAAAAPPPIRRHTDSDGTSGSEGDDDDGKDVAGDDDANTQYWSSAWKRAAVTLRGLHERAWTKRFATRGRMLALCRAVYAAGVWVAAPHDAEPDLAPLHLALLPAFPRLPPPSTARALAAARGVAAVPCTVVYTGGAARLCVTTPAAAGDVLALDVEASPLWAVASGSGALSVCDLAARGVFGPSDDCSPSACATVADAASRLTTLAAADAVAEVASALADGVPLLSTASLLCPSERRCVPLPAGLP